jgi:hypothetical protein
VCQTHERFTISSLPLQKPLDRVAIPMAKPTRHPGQSKRHAGSTQPPA